MLEELLAVKPLFEAGAIQFISLKSAATHPSQTLHYTDGDDDALRGDQVIAEAIDLLSPIHKKMGDEPFRYAMFWNRKVIGSQLNVLRGNPGDVHLLAGNAFEAALQMLAVAVGDDQSSKIADPRAYRMRSLMAIPVPILTSDSKKLVALRSSDEFLAWRTTLASALGDVQGLLESNESWESDARAIVSSELTPMRERLERSVRKSPALSAMKKGLRDMTLSGIGALGGAAAGGRLGTALVGAGTGKAAEVFVEYLKAVRERRKSQAILDLAIRLDVNDV
ncbi:hypothetical protein [Micromonospora chersina]|uniref:hypothetical protein n=1 Tax=Micromonospora chersina TaxID=47854 RepID=UPI0037100FFC